MKKYLKYISHVAISAIFILAIYLLYNKLKGYSIIQIRESIDQISYTRIGLSLLLMILNYIILVGYDWLALKAIHKTLPIGKVGLVSFIGQTVSYNFGALLGGTSVRYRFYSAWGFSLTDIVRLVLMLAVTFWVGALGLCGIIFLITPPQIPDALIQGMPIKDVRILGLILTVMAATYLVSCFCFRKPIHIFKKEFVFPAPRIAIAQCIVAGIDIVAAAACMFVLLPGNIGISFLEFLPSYLMAQVAVVLTHVPGGVGVFELVILELTHTPQEQAVFAGVLLFRLIYYILPLLIAALLLVIYEVRQNKSMMRETGRWLAVLSHSISAFLVFLAGGILLFSATFPTAWTKLPEIYQEVPRSVLTFGHFICALSGAALLFVSYGLEKRQKSAYRIVKWLMCIGITGAILKGFSWETAAMAGIILFTLHFTKKRFYRISPFYRLQFSINWIVSALVVLGFCVSLGWFLYHPAWDRATLWGFDSSFNSSRVLISYFGIFTMLVLAWLWRMWMIKKNKE